MCHSPVSTEVEHIIEEALDELTIYYRSNPDKTQVTSFHLKNREAKRTLEVKWNNTDLENTPHPNNLSVTLDRTLSHKQHIHNTKMKVATRNNLLKKLSNSKWDCNASTIRTTALSLSYPAAEYACTVLARCGCCCLPTPMALASGGSPMFPLVVHQPASPSIWPAVQSLRRGLSTNPGATMWCVCGCS